MRWLLIAGALVVLAGCASAPGQKVSGDGQSPLSVYHDEARGVTCWIYGDGGTYGKAISCLPDTEISR